MLTVLGLSLPILFTPQIIDVRVQVLLGSMFIGNRIFTTQKLE